MQNLPLHLIIVGQSVTVRQLCIFCSSFVFARRQELPNATKESSSSEPNMLHHASYTIFQLLIGKRPSVFMLIYLMTAVLRPVKQVSSKDLIHITWSCAETVSAITKAQSHLLMSPNLTAETSDACAPKVHLKIKVSQRSSVEPNCETFQIVRVVSSTTHASTKFSLLVWWEANWWHHLQRAKLEPDVSPRSWHEPRGNRAHT